jgi:hypothetical protein
MTEILKLISALEKEALEKNSELKRIKRIYEKYSDLGYNQDRGGQIRLTSPSVNSIADRVDISYSYVCCDDATIIARPYAWIGVTKVYSDPVQFVVGEKHYRGGDEAYDNWQNKLIDAGLSQIIIDEIEKYFKQNKPDDWDDEVLDDLGF